MGTWVRIQGQIHVNLAGSYHRFNENQYVYEYYQNMKNRITKWIEKSFRKHLRIGLGIDCGCQVSFFDFDQYYRNQGYDFFDRPIVLSEYTRVVINLNEWDRNGDFNHGQRFIEDVFNKLRTNSIYIDDLTYVTVAPDYASNKLIYTTQGMYNVDFANIAIDRTKKLTNY